MGITLDGTVKSDGTNRSLIINDSGAAILAGAVGGAADDGDGFAGVVGPQACEACLEHRRGHVELDGAFRHAGIGPFLRAADVDKDDLFRPAALMRFAHAHGGAGWQGLRRGRACGKQHGDKQAAADGRTGHGTQIGRSGASANWPEP